MASTTGHSSPVAMSDNGIKVQYSVHVLAENWLKNKLFFLSDVVIRIRSVTLICIVRVESRTCSFKPLHGSSGESPQFYLSKAGSNIISSMWSLVLIVYTTLQLAEVHLYNTPTNVCFLSRVHSVWTNSSKCNINN